MATPENSQQRRYRIAVIPGDGIGKEVVRTAADAPGDGAAGIRTVATLRGGRLNSASSKTAAARRASY